MRGLVLLAVCGLAFPQSPDPAYEPLTRAYEALRGRDYDTAIASFLRGIDAAPRRASIHKDLAYTYLKIGENQVCRGCDVWSAPIAAFCRSRRASTAGGGCYQHPYDDGKSLPLLRQEPAPAGTSKKHIRPLAVSHDVRTLSF